MRLLIAGDDKDTEKKSAPRAKGEIRLATILVPIDFSPASLRSIAWAKFLSGRTGAKFISSMCTIFPSPFRPRPRHSPARRAEIEERLQYHLEALAKEERLLDATVHVREGRSFHEICQLAEEIRADLIVLATHGRTGWKRALLGSTAEQ